MFDCFNTGDEDIFKERKVLWHGSTYVHWETDVSSPTLSNYIQPHILSSYRKLLAYPTTYPHNSTESYQHTQPLIPTIQQKVISIPNHSSPQTAILQKVISIPNHSSPQTTILQKVISIPNHSSPQTATLQKVIACIVYPTPRLHILRYLHPTTGTEWIWCQR